MRPQIDGRCVDSVSLGVLPVWDHFLIFDVETIFLFPFATAFLDLSFGAFVAMMVFLLLLVEGLIWAWRKGVLTWR
jgi:NADH:ubiquinone oxidoreductase subunit 3 (subunit A)